MSFKEVLFITFLFFSHLSFATIKARHRIDSIEDVEDAAKRLITRDFDQLLLVLDFDKTISADDGNHAVFKYRENEKTFTTIHSLQDLKFKTIVLTSRGLGQSQDLQQNTFLTSTQFMNQAELRLDRFGALPNKIEKEVNINYKDRSAFVNIRGSYVFAGTADYHSNKAAALKELIEKKTFTISPTHIFVVDDTANNFPPFEEIFESREEQVYLFYYPNQAK